MNPSPTITYEVDVAIGATVQDRVTGIEGRVTAVSFHGDGIAPQICMTYTDASLTGDIRNVWLDRPRAVVLG